MRGLKANWVGIIAILWVTSGAVGQTLWQAGTGDWFTESNWTLGVPNVASPTAFDAIIANSGTAQLQSPGASVRRLRVGLAGGPGHLLIEGGELTVTDNLHLNEGSAGAASVIVQGGSTVTAPSTVVGYSSNFATSFLISGVGTVYNATTSFAVGRLGADTASLTVEDGALLTSGTSTIASFSGSTGGATVTGAGSRWSSTGAFTVGSAVTGVLNIENQGTVHVGTDLSIGSTSNVNLNGGTLRFATVTGVDRINYTAGTIQIPSTGFFNAPVTTFFGATPTITAGKTLVLETLGFLQSGAPVVVDGGHLSMASVSSNSGSSLSITAGSAVIGDAAFVNRGTITVSGPNASLQTDGSFTVQSGTGSGSSNAFLNVSNGATVFINGDLLINHPDFNFPPTAAVNLNGGTLRFKDFIKVVNAFGAQFNYTAGTIQLSGGRDLSSDATIPQLFGASPTIAAGKGLTVEGTARLTTVPVTLAGGTLAAGTLAVMPGGRLQTTLASQVVGPVVALPGSVIDATGGALVIGDAGKVNGFYSNGTLMVGANTVTLQDANDAVFDSASLTTFGSATTAGTLSAANGLTLDFGGNITGFGTVNTPNLLSKPLINNGHITGTSPAEPITLPGYVKGVGTFDNVNITGTFSPGLSPAILSVGNMDFSPTSTLVMELGGTTPGSGYDQLQSSGTLTLGGTLQISLLNGFVPSPGQSFEFLMADDLLGSFSSVQLPSLPGLNWDVSQLATGMLSVALPGDFDLDGDVDGRDFLIWQRGGSPNQLSASDLADWKGNYGPGSLRAASVAVPEPATGILLLLTVIVFFKRGNIGQCRRLFFRKRNHEIATVSA